MKKIIACGLVGALVAQIWGTISWVALPWHMGDFKEFTNPEPVAASIVAQAPESGLYTLPNMDPTVHEDPEKMDAWNALLKKGPFAFMTIKVEGADPGMGKAMAYGFGFNILISILILWVFSKSVYFTSGSMLASASFMGIVGMLGSIYPHMSNWNWWHFPISYCLVGVVDLFITWFLAGLAIKKLSSKLG
jgi:hypothetical protein